MHPIDLNYLLNGALLAIIGAIIGWIVGSLKANASDSSRHRKQERIQAKREAEALKSGMRALLRAELMRAHKEYCERGWCSTTEKEIITRTYDAYHALGGNGLATSLYEDIMELPSFSPVTVAGNK